MNENSNQNNSNSTEDIRLIDIWKSALQWINLLMKKWLIIGLFAIIGMTIGFFIAYTDKPIYSANLTFALEDEKSGSGLSGAMGLASTLGIDLGTGAGGAFSGANLIELMKSRRIVEKALLNQVNINNQNITLLECYIDFSKMNKKWDSSLLNLDFKKNEPAYQFLKDSIIGIVYNRIVGEKGILSVFQKDKKIGIINIDVSSENEVFSKLFAENIATEVSEFYIDSKSKKARNNVSILQRQADSVRNELNSAITGVAIANDNVYNLNPAMVANRVPSSRKQVDVQANTAILTQLVTNLEMAKVTLLKETPLIQVIDKPVLPLKKTKLGKLKTMLLGAFFAIVFSSIGIIITNSRKIATSRN